MAPSGPIAARTSRKQPATRNPAVYGVRLTDEQVLNRCRILRKDNPPTSKESNIEKEAYDGYLVVDDKLTEGWTDPHASGYSTGNIPCGAWKGI